MQSVFLIKILFIPPVYLCIFLLIHMLALLSRGVVKPSNEMFHSYNVLLFCSNAAVEANTEAPPEFSRTIYLHSTGFNIIKFFFVMVN